MFRKDKRPTASALLGVAAFQALVGFLGWSVYSIHFKWYDWAITFSFVLYVLLSIWARWMPIPPAVIGFGLYGGFLGLQAIQSIELLRTGWMFKLPVVVLLVIALVFSFKSSAPEGAS